LCIDGVSRSALYAKARCSASIGLGPHRAINYPLSMSLLASYLLTLRKQRGLSQPQLAVLLDLTAIALSRFESVSRRPSAELLIGAEVIFGRSPRAVFPAFYRETERAILERTRAQYEQLRSSPDSSARKRLKVLAEIIERAEHSRLNV